MDDQRNETPDERYDRNWGELLQELRVTLTGVQILAGFLLTLPFTQRFTGIPHGWHALYLVTFAGAMITIGLLIAPVVAHRLLFGRHEKGTLVEASDRVAKAGLAVLGLTLVATATLIFGVVLSWVAGAVAGVLLGLGFLGLWLGLPLRLRG